MSASPDEILSMVCFARVVEAGSFTGAADKLDLSKSVVSARVAQLEERLGVRLLNRTTRKLSLTPEGMALYERCARVVNAADAAAGPAEGTVEVPRGVLRVHAPPVFAHEYLAGPMATYLERYPLVRLELTLGDKAIDLRAEGIDVAIRIASGVDSANLGVRKLASDYTVLCASPAYLKRRGTPTAAEHLVQHDCLVYSLLRISDDWRFRTPGGRDTFTVPIEGRFSAASGAVLREAALAGMGIAVLPSHLVAEDLAMGRLVRVVETFHGAQLGVHAVYPQGKRPTGNVRLFIDLLVAHFRRPRWGSTTLQGLSSGGGASSATGGR